MEKVVVYKAKKVITMDPNRPTATHIAVMGDRILAVGDADCADQWWDVTHDDSLSDFVLTPGVCRRTRAYDGRCDLGFCLCRLP